MKNILSYKPGSTFSGEEIIRWANYQINNNTSHKKQGLDIVNRFNNISHNKQYKIVTSYKGTGCGEIINRIQIQNIEK